MDRVIAGASRADLGRHVFGVATLATGIVALAWHSFGQFHFVTFAAAVAEVVGGAAMLFRWSAKVGAIVAGAGYLTLAALGVPGIFVQPQVYNNWGNFFEQLSLATGAATAYAYVSSRWSPASVSLFARVLIGICTVSFAAEQAVYIGATAGFVPKWIPPSQMFWAQATTVMFALAALALLTNRVTLLATRLLTTMLALFGLLVWIPLLLLNPRSHTNWSETAETFAIAGAVWILADLLGSAERTHFRVQ